MKKLLAFAITVVLIATCLVGCGGSDSKDDNKLETVTEGKLTMATNAEFPPYEFYEGEKVVGIDAEVAEKIAEKLGLELEIADVSFDSIIPGVQSGKYDMGMAGMTVTDERKRSVNFSDSYATGIQSVIVKEDSTIKSIDDLDGKKITFWAEKDGQKSAVETLNFNIKTGIEDIDVENAEAIEEEGDARYFNLQGLEVKNPGEGIYIRVANGKATKILKK